MSKGRVFAPPPWARQHREVLTVEESVRPLEYWLQRPYVGAELREQLAKANVLIVPVEGFRDHEGPVFAKGTEELFHFLKEHSPDGVVVDICIGDDDFHEYSLHDATVELAQLLVGSLVLPLVVNVVWRFIEKRLGGQSGTVKVEMTVVEPDGQARTCRYNGPAEDFEKTMQALSSGDGRPARTLPAKAKPKKEPARRR